MGWVLRTNYNDIETWFTYRANPCNDTALYDPSCPGYAEAYAQYEYDQNCAADALYDSGCPGYATAYFNQQCDISALYDSACPVGYGLILLGVVVWTLFTIPHVQVMRRLCWQKHV